MSSTTSNASHVIKNPGNHKVADATRTALMVAAALGVGSFAFGLYSDPTRAWASFVQNHFYFMSLALGGVFFASLQWLTGAMWSAPIRRLSESLSSYLPFVLVTFVGVALGLHHLYIWSHADHVQGDMVLEGKAAYLNPTFFVIRNLIGVGIWLFFAKKLVGNSISQDSSGSYSLTLANRKWAPAFLILFGVSFTMASFDQLMSLDPHWFSTMFGVYCFAGLFYSTLAATCLLALSMREKGKLDGILNDNHLHDLGKFMFAFTVFWAYIAFSQFMLIWYANLPEETGYYIDRFHGNWMKVSAFLLIGKFMVPFFSLLPRGAKRCPGTLRKVAWFMLVAQWVDVMWMVQPNFFKEGPVFGFIELGVTAGFIGIFGLFVSRFLEKNNIVAVGDPRLHEAAFHHHQ